MAVEWIRKEGYDEVHIPDIGMRPGLQLAIYPDGRLTVQLYDTPERVLEATFDKSEVDTIKRALNGALPG